MKKAQIKQLVDLEVHPAIIGDMNENGFRFEAIEQLTMERGQGDDFEVSVISLMDNEGALNAVLTIKGPGHSYQVQLGGMRDLDGMFSVQAYEIKH